MMATVRLSCIYSVFFFSSRRRHTRCSRDWSSDVCSSDLDDSELTRRVLLLSRLESDGFGGSGGVWRCLLWPSRTPWHDGCTVTTELQKGSMFTTAAPMDAASVRCHICASRTCQNEWANCLSTYTCRRKLPAQL